MAIRRWWWLVKEAKAAMGAQPLSIVRVFGGLAVIVTLAATAQAQVPGTRFPTEITAIRHNSGQPVIPYFEGWIRNPDGTFDMVFGYFNRNYVEEFAIPAGADNSVEPGAADQGQPTYFLPRRQRYVYRMRVPADFGKKEVVWTINSNGRTEKAYGNLLPEQEITERVVATNGNYDPGLDDPNQAPSIAIAALPAVSVGIPVTLTAKVTDDGLPKQRAVVAEPPPQATAAGGFTAQRNSSTNTRPPRGVTVTWLQYSGPAKVTFAQTGTIDVANGQAVTTATFAAAGTYKLVASAADPGRLSTKTEVTVIVPAGRSSSR
jgi:hypothetical protein